MRKDKPMQQEEMERKKRKRLTHLVGVSKAVHTSFGVPRGCSSDAAIERLKNTNKQKNTLKVAIILSFSDLNVQIRQVHFFKHRLQFWAFYLTSYRMHWLLSSIKERCFKSTRFLPFLFIILTFVKVLLHLKAAETVNLHVWTFALKPFLCS